jgi:hypothetical protein
MPGNFITPLPVAASVDRIIGQNIQWPDQTFTVGTYAVTDLMHTLLGDASGGNIIFNLATAVGRSGMRFTFKKVDGSVNNVTFNAAGLETIDGVSSIILVQPNEVYEIESNGANWKIVSHNIAGGTPGISNLDIKSIIKTDNDFSSLNPVPGTTISFTTTRSGVSFLSCSAFTSGLSVSVYSGSIGINVDGTPYTLFVDAQNNGAGGDFTSDMGYAGSIGVSLAPGVHTAFVFVTQSVIGFQATAGAPLTLTVIFPTLSGPTAMGSPISFQEVTTSGVGSDTTASTVFVPIPGTLITLPAFATSQTVFFAGMATALRNGTAQTTAHIGLRIDGVTDYPGTAPQSDLGNFIDHSLVVTKALTLSPGVHTAELVYLTESGAVPAVVSINAVKPARLTAIFTVPQAIVTNGEAVAESDSASDSTGSGVLVATGATVTITLANTSVIQAKAFTTGVASGGGNSFWAVAIALNVDGTSYTEQSGYSFANSVSPTLFPMAVFKDIVLGPGLHTVTLMFRNIANGSGASGVLSSSHLSVVYKV